MTTASGAGAPGTRTSTRPDPYVVPTVGTRLLARVYDVLLLSGLNLVIATAWLLVADRRMGDAVVFSVVGASAVAYEAVSLRRRGATLGKVWCGIRVIREDRAALSLAPVIARSAVLWLGLWGLPLLVVELFTSGVVRLIAQGLIVVVIFVPLFRDARRRGWHDRVAKTVVAWHPAVRRRAPYPSSSSSTAAGARPSPVEPSD